MKILLIDNYDSFTFMLKDYIEQCEADTTVIRNDDKILDFDYIDNFNAIVISPGPKTPNQSGNLMSIIQSCFESKPILGICLGHQAIGEFFGAKLAKASLPRHGKVDSVTHNNHFLFNGIDTKFKATRYHTLLIENVKTPLEIIAKSDTKEVMAIAHQSLPIFGIQFHPESCLTKCGLKLINNFVVYTNQLT